MYLQVCIDIYAKIVYNGDSKNVAPTSSPAIMPAEGLPTSGGFAYIP